MLNLDPSKLLIIAVVAVIVLGPNKLPHVARQVGDAWRSFSEFRQRMESEVRNSIPDLPSTTDLATYARSPSVLLNRLSSTTSESDSATEIAELVSDLPPICASDRPHWTSVSYDAPTLTSSERTGLEAQAPTLGDAAFN
jgi:TatA/E family protein of Tat protein translocase